MLSLTTLAVLALSHANLHIHASILPRDLADMDVKRQALHEERSASE